MKSIQSTGLRGLVTLLIAGLVFAACGESPPTSMDPGSISGTVSIDGVGAPGITIDLNGDATSASATTDGAGMFSFVNLEPGAYTVSVAGTDTELVTFDALAQNVTLNGGQQRNVTFTGTPTGVQRVMVYAYYGIEGSKPNVAPAEGFQIDVYRTSADRSAQSNRLDRATTGVTGAAVLTFDRSADTGEGGGASDNTVYTRVTGTPGPRQIGQTDLQQTVSYQTHQVVAFAPDTVDALNGNVTAELRIQTILTDYTGPEGSALLKPEWSARTRVDTAAAGLDNDSTGFDGVASFDLFTDVGSLPQTIYFRLDDSQKSDAGNIWTQTPEPTALSSGAGRHLVYVHDGTQPPGTVDLGIQRVEYITTSVFAPVFHENDLAEATPIYTPGADDKSGSSDILMEILADDQSTVLYSRMAPTNGEAFWNGPNFPSEPFRAELISQNVYFVRASSTNPNIEIVTQAMYQVGQAGGGSVGAHGPGLGGFRHSSRVCPLAADTVIVNCGAFAFKYNNTTVRGTISNGGGVSGMTVNLYRCVPPDRASCTRDGDPITTTTNGSGVYSFPGRLEDIYEVVPDPSSVGLSSVSPDGGSPIVVTNGSGDTKTKNFTAS